jgi:hypothetical protein
MKKIFFYGNCQSYEITNVLSKSFDPLEWNIIKIKCFETNIKQSEFDEIIKTSDVIITQPITDNYRNCEYLSTSYMLKNCNKNCRIIMFPSCYFKFYYFDLINIQIESKLNKIHDNFHYKELLESYKNNLSVNYFIDNCVNNINLKSSEELLNIANISLQMLENKELKMFENIILNNNLQIITVSKFIRQNYKKKLLFYSENHPTKYLLQFISEKILYLLNLNNNIDYTADPLIYPKWYLYLCLANVVDFDIKYINSCINNYNIDDISNLYWLYYKNSIL